MAGRRKANDGDNGEAGKSLLYKLVREPLEVSVRNRQGNRVIDLLRYAVTKGGGGANAGSAAKNSVLTSGEKQLKC